MKFKFQTFFDIQTRADTMQILQWSVGGMEVVRRCRHLFGAYKYFKLGKISVKMVPASTLPVDPLGLSYASDDPNSVDPRDQMNPGLVRITNGEDVFTNVSALPNESIERAVYNNMMLDPRWSKFMLQSGFRRSAYPLYWQIGQLSQDEYPGATVNLPPTPTSGTTGLSTVESRFRYIDSTTPFADKYDVGSSAARGLFQVGHKGRLGYLPTDYYQEFWGVDADVPVAGIKAPPSVSVITCVLPRAYKTLYYYRVFITEEVYFAGLRSSPVTSGGVMVNGIDNFVIGQPTALKPGNTLGDPTGFSIYGNDGSDLP